MAVSSRKSAEGMEIEDYVFSVSRSEAASIERPLEKRRLKLFWWLIVLALVVLGGRIFYLNVLRGNHYQEVALGNNIRSVVIRAPRGKIFDRSGKILVNNIPSLDAALIPADLPEDDARISSLAERISGILGINAGEIIVAIENADRHSFSPILLKENISQDEALALAESGGVDSGVAIDQTAIREYADSTIFSHILGYEGKIEKREWEANSDYLLTDYIGKDGLEKYYEKELRGKNGAYQVEVDSQGNVKKERGIVPPRSGNDLILSLDGELQKKIYDSLTAVLEKTGTSTAAAVAIDPRSGEVLALISLPSYDNNLFARKISGAEYLSLIRNPDKPLFNRAIAGEYPPGSTLKPAVAVAGLAEGKIDSHTTISCHGSIGIGNFSFGDWKTHGTVDIRSAIAESCDVFFYSLGGGYGPISGLGMSRMKEYEQRFGLGAVTGIDLLGESAGFIPDEQWKMEKFGERWYTGNSYHASIGQGFVTATPLQLANYTAAIANRGTLYRPYLVSRIQDREGETRRSDPKIIRDNRDLRNVIQIVREGMRQTVVSGTAQSLNDLTVAAAGKTGTAQFGKDDLTHAWFISFAPFDNPEIAMAVLVEGGGEGHSSAVPVTKEVYSWYFSRR